MMKHGKETFLFARTFLVCILLAAAALAAAPSPALSRPVTRINAVYEAGTGGSSGDYSAYGAPNGDFNTGTLYDIHYNQGPLNNLRILNLELGADVYHFITISDNININRVDNAGVTGIRHLAWHESVGPVGGTDIYLVPTGIVTMEQVLKGRYINLGTDNVFDNTAGNNKNNIERIDFVFPGGLSVPAAYIDDIGFGVLERSGNDSVKIAPILAIDGSLAPTSIGPLVTIQAGSGWGPANSSDSYSYRTVVARQDPTDTHLRPSADLSPQTIRGFLVTFGDLGIAGDQVFHGYSLFGPDTPDTASIRAGELTDCPTNTPSSQGGMDLIEGGGLFSKDLPVELVDVSVDKTSDTDAAWADSFVSYTVTVTNPGVVDSQGLRVQDVFPPELDNVSWTCTGVNGGVCGAASGAGDIDQIVDVPSEGSVVFSIDAHIVANADDVASNTATISTSGSEVDVTPQNNSSTKDIEIQVPEIVVSKTVTDPDDLVQAGDTVNWRIEVTKALPGPASHVVVTDALPPGLTYVPGSTTATGPVRKEVLDTFSTVAWDGQDGPDDWKSDWSEYDTLGPGPGDGNVLISGGSLQLDDHPNSNTTPWAAREVDLSGGYTYASLSLDYFTTHGVDTNDEAVIEISPDGSAFTVLETFANISGATTGSRNYDISSYISSNTTVRFRITNWYGAGNETFGVDNVSIVARSATTASFRDEFNAVSYSGSDGTGAWDGSWQEINEGDGPANGDEAVVNDSGDNRLRVQNSDGGGEGVWRAVDLTPYSEAVLEFDYRRSSLDNPNDYVTVSVYDMANGQWVELDRFAGPDEDADYVHTVYDMSPYAGSATAIRFLSSAQMSQWDRLYVDNVEIRGIADSTVVKSNAAGALLPLVDGAAPNLVGAGDQFRLSRGQTLAVEFQAVVDDPLAPGTTAITNTTSASSDETVAPFTDATPLYVPRLDSFTGGFSTGEELYRRDPSATGQGTDAIYTGGESFGPNRDYEVAYYDGQGQLVYTDTVAATPGTGFLESSYPNNLDAVAYGQWTAVAVADGTLAQPTLAAQLAEPTTITWDTFEVRSWSLVRFTDDAGDPAYGFDTSAGSGTAYMSLTDPDRNTDPSTIQSITVTVSDPTTGDEESLVLYETGPDTGVFAHDASGSLFGLPLSKSIGASPDDGILYVVGGYTIEIGYADTRDAPDTSAWEAYIATHAVVRAMNASEYPGGAVVTWETASEIGTVGFRLLRTDPDGRETDAGGGILPGLLVSPRGGEYTFVDNGAPAGEPVSYRLLEVDARGAVHERARTSLSPNGIPVHEDELPGGGYHRKPHPRTAVAPPARAAAAGSRGGSVTLRDPDPCLDGETGAAKIVVSQTGLVQITSAQAARLLCLDQLHAEDMIREYGFTVQNRGKPVSWLAAADGSALYFYGTAMDGIYTEENVYWLKPGQGRPMAFAGHSGDVNGDGGVGMADAVLALRIATGLAVPPPGTGDAADVDGDREIGSIEAVFALQTEAGLRNAKGATVQETSESFADVLRLERERYDTTAYFRDPRADAWCWDVLYSGVPEADTATHGFSLCGVAPVEEAATLTVRLMAGAPAGDDGRHRAILSVNGVEVGEATWTGPSQVDVGMPFSQELLVDGENTVSVRGVIPAGASFFVTYVDSIEIGYRRLLDGCGGVLAFTPETAGETAVGGLPGPDVLVLDVSDPLSPRRLRAGIQEEAGLHTALFRPVAPGGPHLAATLSGAWAPDRMVRDQPSDLKSLDTEGDWVAVAPRDLMDGVEPLADLRRFQGFKARVVALEDVMDEFNHGVHSPEAVRDFLFWAWHSWRLPPKHVLLVGKGTLDYKNAQGFADNLLPALATGTPDGLFPSDIEFTHLGGEAGDRAMAVGRLPVTTLDELVAVVDKIIAHDQALGGQWSRRVVLAADDGDSAGDFALDSMDLAEAVPDAYSVDTVNLGPLGISGARDRLLSYMEEGALLLNYLGHAGLDTLAQEGLLTNSDVDSLANGDRLPVVSALSCVLGQSLSGYRSLGEALLLHPDGGAVAVWAPTGLSDNREAVRLGREFFDAVFLQEEQTLGEALQQALAAYQPGQGRSHMLRIYLLLGDPATRLR
ncbi:MAG: C25 family cysteine peptidase [Desulfatibacillaceae bacterium]